MSIEQPENCIFISPELAENPAIPSEALRIYAIINRFCAGGGGANISGTRIAERMGRDRKIIERHIRWLIDHKMIGRMEEPGRSGGRKITLWTEPPEKWEIEKKAERCETHLSDHGGDSHPTTGAKHTRRRVQNTPVGREVASSLKQGLKSKSGKAASGVSVWSLSNDEVLPEEWKANEDFTEAWGDWILQRQKKKFALTARARKIQATKLLERSGGQLATAIEMLDRATNKGWGECFELDGSEAKGKDPASNPLIQ